jgi:AcrR family transcriptional regulator
MRQETNVDGLRERLYVRTRTLEQKEKILEAASGLFGTQRFHEVRMDDIADVAAVGKGTLYRYFEDKEQLYLAVLARSSADFMNRVCEGVTLVEGLRAQLEALVSVIISYFDAQPHLMDLIQRSELESASGKEFPWYETRQSLIRFIRDLFAAAEDRGEASIRNPELAVFMLLGGLRTIIRLGVKPRPRGLARQVVDNYLLGAGTHERRPTARVQALLR